MPSEDDEYSISVQQKNQHGQDHLHKIHGDSRNYENLSGKVDPLNQRLHRIDSSESSHDARLKKCKGNCAAENVCAEVFWASIHDKANRKCHYRHLNQRRKHRKCNRRWGRPVFAFEFADTQADDQLTERKKLRQIRLKICEPRSSRSNHRCQSHTAFTSFKSAQPPTIHRAFYVQVGRLSMTMTRGTREWHSVGHH